MLALGIPLVTVAETTGCMRADAMPSNPSPGVPVICCMFADGVASLKVEGLPGDVVLLSAMVDAPECGVARRWIGQA